MDTQARIVRVCLCVWTCVPMGSSSSSAAGRRIDCTVSAVTMILRYKHPCIPLKLHVPGHRKPSRRKGDIARKLQHCCMVQIDGALQYDRIRAMTSSPKSSSGISGGHGRREITGLWDAEDGGVVAQISCCGSRRFESDIVMFRLGWDVGKCKKSVTTRVPDHFTTQIYLVSCLVYTLHDPYQKRTVTVTSPTVLPNFRATNAQISCFSKYARH